MKYDLGIKRLIFVFLFIAYFAVLPVFTWAQHFTSPSYIIDWGNFNITSGKKNSPNYSLTDTVGQIAPGPYTSTGYQLRSGFQYIYDTLNNTFSFEISTLDIAFGPLTPGVGVTQTHTITISTPSGHGYDIIALANAGFTNITGATIPPTSCDTGTCTPSVSGLWTGSTVYGFGFNAVGLNTSGVATNIGTSQYFSTPNHFRPFSLTTDNQFPAFMTETTPVKNRTARLTYKANISPLQSAGDYQTSVIFTAIPQY